MRGRKLAMLSMKASRRGSKRPASSASASSAPSRLMTSLLRGSPLRRAARGLGERRRQVGRERTPDLDMEGRLRAAPKHDLHFVEQSARREAHREGLEVQVKRAAGVEGARRGRTAGDQAYLAMRDVNEAVRGFLEHRLQHFAYRGGVGAVRN